MAVGVAVAVCAPCPHSLPCPSPLCSSLQESGAINEGLDRLEVLLLGAEKEGIPAALLPELDIVLEIPQLGRIRSLNVHVSAAMVVWEYTRQRLDDCDARHLQLS